MALTSVEPFPSTRPNPDANSSVTSSSSRDRTTLSGSRKVFSMRFVTSRSSGSLSRACFAALPSILMPPAGYASWLTCFPTSRYCVSLGQQISQTAQSCNVGPCSQISPSNPRPTNSTTIHSSPPGSTSAHIDPSAAISLSLEDTTTSMGMGSLTCRRWSRRTPLRV
jgi:hypothetical protein